MKIVILNPSFGEDFVRVARWAAKSRGRVQRHPDYLLIAAQVLIDAGHNVSFIEAAARNFTPEESYDLCEKEQPDLLVIHATTPSIYNDIEQAREIKKRTGCRVVFIGQHVSAEPDNTFEISKGIVEYIARREYDFTLRDLAAGKPLQEILGLSWMKDGDVIHNLERPPLDAKELPFPAWNLIKPEWYPDAGKKFPFLTLITGRGCNNACLFCRDPQLMYGHCVRSRDPLTIVDEMENDLKIFPQICEIMIETDTFAADIENATAVCNEIIKRELHKKITFSCNTRIDTPLELLPLMTQANFRMLMTGFEFGYDAAFKAIRKGRVNIEMARKFSEEAHRLGFTIHGCFMIGAPDETKETARQTIDFAKSLPLDTIQITGIAVYPGTAMYHWAKENNFILADDWRDWLTAECEQKTIVNYPQLSAGEIDKLIDIGLKEFYLRPKQMWQMLISIRSFGDVLRKIYGLKAFINYFGKSKH